jgi:hypothetical protein
MCCYGWWWWCPWGSYDLAYLLYMDPSTMDEISFSSSVYIVYHVTLSCTWYHFTNHPSKVSLYMALQYINALAMIDTWTCSEYPSSMYNVCHVMSKAINMIGIWHIHEQAMCDTYVYMSLSIIYDMKCSCMRTLCKNTPSALSLMSIPFHWRGDFDGTCHICQSRCLVDLQHQSVHC